jgi:hypothetical protein
LHCNFSGFGVPPLRELSYSAECSKAALGLVETLDGVGVEEYFRSQFRLDFAQPSVDVVVSIVTIVSKGADGADVQAERLGNDAYRPAAGTGRDGDLYALPDYLRVI